eukprot:CAMPEP_0194440428 /NCGR_PEP_ID=MMETSP0176-20130528/115799_1 /TAXON_ID=216777 /ORGANISM="Proboscia alata, Strain PI-D3" /LENGTH=173 /DNA_ID=CAMNT_0039264669 /DNA_START=176 /DNA_END=694 /DNA_ORIENTATION=+
MAQGIWSGVAMLISYLWGTVVFGETPSHMYLSLFGLILLLFGIMIVALSESIGDRFYTRYTGIQYQSALLPTLDEDDAESSEKMRGLRKYSQGVLWACTVGISGGSILAPMHYVPEDNQGIRFLPSFGVGTAICSPIILILYHTITNKPQLQFHVKDALTTGSLSGLVWNIGN